VFGERRLVERRAVVASDGSFELAAPDSVERDPEARLAVLAPSGEMLASRPFAALRRPGARLDDIAVEPPRPGFTPTPIARRARLTVRLKGRVLVTGAPPGAAGGVAVLLVGRRGRDGTAVPLWTGTTDRNG